MTKARVKTCHVKPSQCAVFKWLGNVYKWFNNVCSPLQNLGWIVDAVLCEVAYTAACTPDELKWSAADEKQRAF